MELKVGRFKSNHGVTIGELWINNKFFCYTLEDEIRPVLAKIWGKTAIPQGKYTVILSFSNRFQKYLPEILNVPGFKGVRIHSGNSHLDTHGCLLVGQSTNGYNLFDSKDAMDRLMVELKLIENKEKITIEYINLNKEYKIS